MRIVSCFVLGLLLLGPAAAWACADVEPAPAVKECADESSAQAAKEHYALGFEAAEKRDYEGALQAFKKAYAACPQFAILYNMGQAQIALDRPLEAIAALSHYLREGKDQIPPERIPVVKEQMRLLEGLVGKLQVNTVPPGAQIAIDGCKRGRTPLAIWLEPGVHQIWATLDDYEPEESSVIVGQGQQHVLVLHLTPLEPPPPPPPPPSRLRVAMPYVLVGIGALLAAGAGSAYIWERYAHENWQDAQPGLQKTLANVQPGSPEYAKAAKENNRLANSVTTAKYTMLGLAIGSGVLLTTGALLYRFDRLSKGRSATPTIAWSGGASFTAGWRYSW